MHRHLVLFARAPGREAREKGFAGSDAADLFASFAQGWWEAAKAVGARLVVASPREDRFDWRRCLGDVRPHLWIGQRGVSLGERLEDAARSAAALGATAVIVGGDVAPSARALATAFAALETGADAVIGGAPDGGVSLLALPTDDLDLLAAIAPRRRDVFARLRARLLARGRRLFLVAASPDVDGRRSLKALIASPGVPGALRLLARAALRRASLSRPGPAAPPAPGRHAPSCLRGPPAVA